MAHWSFLIWVPVSSRTSAPATRPHHPGTPSAPASASSCRFSNPAHSCLRAFAAAAPSSRDALPPVASPPVVSQPSSLKQQPSSLPAVFPPSPSPATAVICAPYNGGSGEQGHMSVSHRAPAESRMAVTSLGAPGALLLRLSCVKMLQQPQPSPLPPRRSWLFSRQVLPEEKGGAPATTGQTPTLGMSIGSHWPSLAHRPTPEPTALATGACGALTDQVCLPHLPWSWDGTWAPSPEDNCDSDATPRGPRAQQANRQ